MSIRAGMAVGGRGAHARGGVLGRRLLHSEGPCRRPSRRRRRRRCGAHHGWTLPLAPWVRCPPIEGADDPRVVTGEHPEKPGEGGGRTDFGCACGPDTAAIVGLPGLVWHPDLKYAPLDAPNSTTARSRVLDLVEDFAMASPVDAHHFTPASRSRPSGSTCEPGWPSELRRQSRGCILDRDDQ